MTGGIVQSGVTTTTTTDETAIISLSAPKYQSVPKLKHATLRYPIRASGCSWAVFWISAAVVRQSLVNRSFDVINKIKWNFGITFTMGLAHSIRIWREVGTRDVFEKTLDPDLRK